MIFGADQRELIGSVILGRVVDSDVGGVVRSGGR